MSRKKIIIASSVALFLALLAFAVYFVAIRNAESSLKYLIEVQSKGTLTFDVKKIKFDLIKLRFDFNQAEIRTRDTSTTVTGYHAKIAKITFDLNSLLPLLHKKQIEIDSLIVISPEIEVFKYKEVAHKKITLPEEMDKVYRSIESVLSILKFDYFHIHSAKFSVNILYDPGTKPLQVSNLNLTINKASADKSLGDDRFLYSDRIRLEITDQDIHFQDENHGVKFKRFYLGTKSQAVKLDSCYIYSRNDSSSTGELGIFFDSIRITKLDFNLFARHQILKFDSAKCINPNINLKIQVSEKNKRSFQNRNTLQPFDSVESKLKKLLGNLDIGYLGVQNASVNVVAQKGDKSISYKSSGSNFSIEKLKVSKDDLIPVSIGQINLNISNYESYSPDSLYVIGFDNVIIRDKKILLNNFKISPTIENHHLLKNEISMKAFEIDDINWMELFTENRIVAGHASLINPELYLTLSGDKREKDTIKTKNPFEVLKTIEAKAKIGKFYIEDGSMNIDVLNGTNFSVNHFYAGIDVIQLLQAENELSLFDAIESFSFDQGVYNNPSIQFFAKNGKYSGVNKSFHFGQIKQKMSDETISVSLLDVKLNGLTLNSGNDFSMSAINWRNAELALNPKKMVAKPDSGINKSKLKLAIGNLSGGQTKLKLKGQDIEATTNINAITTDQIVIESGRKPRISGLFIDGHSSSLLQDILQGNLTDFNIHDKKKSFINNVELKLPMKGKTVNIFVPKLLFSADIDKSINGEITADFIELQNPAISFSANSSASENKSKKAGGNIPLLNIKRLTISQPKFVNLPSELAEKMEMDPGNTSLNFLGINSDSESIKVDSFRFTMVQPKFSANEIKLVPTGREIVTLTGSEFIFHPGTQNNKASWSVNLDGFKTSGILLNMIKSDTLKQAVTISSLYFGSVRLNSNNISNPKEIFRESDRFSLSNGYIKLETKTNSIETFNLKLDKRASTLSLDSIAFFPLIDRSKFKNTKLDVEQLIEGNINAAKTAVPFESKTDSTERFNGKLDQIFNSASLDTIDILSMSDKEAYMAMKKYRCDYIRLYSGKIKMSGLDFNLLMNESILKTRKIVLNDFYLSDYRDKRLPVKITGIEKPKLAEVIKNIKMKLAIDSILLKNSRIDYEEFNDKTNQSGTIHFDNIRGAITGIKNYNLTDSDSIGIHLFTRLMDATDLRLSYAQSYTDSLSTFYLKTIVSPFDLTALNPILRPFASAEVTRGYLDTIRMSVIGRKYVAFGVMKMYYHDLHVQYLDKKDNGKNSFKAKLISFFANHIVHTNNRMGTGDVYAERDPYKGFINFWLKIFVGGVFTNTGVKTNKKQEKKYNKSIKYHKVPPIPNIPVDY